MRGRHNIVGSEVGRPRPPYYVREEPKLHATGGARRPAITLVIAVVCAGLGVALTMLF